MFEKFSVFDKNDKISLKIRNILNTRITNYLPLCCSKVDKKKSNFSFMTLKQCNLKITNGELRKNETVLTPQLNTKIHNNIKLGFLNYFLIRNLFSIYQTAFKNFESL